MISDDTKNNDPSLEDDFDIDEFEDDFDIDEFDDEIDGAIAEEIDAAAGAVSPKAASEKSFVQKFFLPIVILVVGIFALLFAFSQGLFTSSNENAPAGQPSIEAASQDASTATQSDEDVRDVTASNEGIFTPEEEQPLTPLPGSSDQANENIIDLADLEMELKDDNELFVDSNPAEFLDLEPVESNALPVDDFNVSEILNIEQTTNNELVDDAIDAVVDVAPLTVSEPVAAVADVIEAPSEFAPVDIQDQTLNSDNNEQLEALTSEKDALQDQVNALNIKYATSEETIASLKAQVAALQADLENVPQASMNSSTETTMAPKIQEPAATVVKKPAVTASKAPVKRSIPAPKSIKWVLKSAQPGVATIARSGSSDLRKIEIGQNVSGLGKIQSVKIENGVWVVRGTSGTVTQ